LRIFTLVEISKRNEISSYSYHVGRRFTDEKFKNVNEILGANPSIRLVKKFNLSA
jgi:hypothetical protein